MNDYDKRRELLYASFDRELTPNEEKMLADYLRDPVLKEEEKELRETRDLLGETSWHFREGFSSRVMERLAKEQEAAKVVEMEPSGQFLSLFRKMALAGVAVIAVLLLSIYLTSGSINKETVFGVDSFSEDNLVSYLLYEDFSE